MSEDSPLGTSNSTGLAISNMLWGRLWGSAVERVWTDWPTGRVPNLVGTRGVCTNISAARSLIPEQSITPLSGFSLPPSPHDDWGTKVF